MNQETNLIAHILHYTSVPLSLNRISRISKLPKETVLKALTELKIAPKYSFVIQPELVDPEIKKIASELTLDYCEKLAKEQS